MGTPQGAVVSPLIANVYLHYVFDLWADVWRRKVAKGDVIIVRYADDLVLGFQHGLMPCGSSKSLKERLAKFGLELHPDKTRLIEFGRYAARDRKQRGEGKPETFNFLGFTHYCGQRHKTKTFTVWRITAKKRMVAKLKAIKAELQRRKHDRTSPGRRMASEGRHRLLPIPRCPRQHRSAAHLQKSRQSTVAATSWFVAVNAPGRSGRRFTPVFERWIPPPRDLAPLSRAPAFTPPILHKSRMRRRARTALYGLCLEAYGIQSPEMETAAKPSSQPRTKSCVMFGDGHCEA